MIPLGISLCVFDTTKQHFGRRDIYRRAIIALNVAAPLKDTFAQRLVHIKREYSADVGEFEAQVAFYRGLGFEVVVSNGDFTHGQSSHQTEYSRDLITVYGRESVQLTPYVLHWESDWAPDVRGEGDFRESICKGMRYLSYRPQIMSLRFPRFLNEVERQKGLRAKHGLNVSVVEETEPPYRGRFFGTNDNVSLNPSIFRSRDLFWATRMLKANFETYAGHVEMGFTHLISYPAKVDDETAHPYAFFNPEDVGVLHWGTREGDEDQVGGVYDR